VKKTYSVYIDEELHDRIEEEAKRQNRTWNNVAAMLLEAAPPLSVERQKERREALREESKRRYLEEKQPVAEVPIKCPSCGDEVFFRLLAPNRWKCDACDKAGTY
jgi:ribosomal protein S27AE